MASVTIWTFLTLAVMASVSRKLHIKGQMFTTGIAIYAAILSTFIFLWNVKQSRPRVVVDIIFSLEEVDGDYVTGVSIDLKNPTSHGAPVNALNLLYPYREVTFIDDIKWFLEVKRLRPYRHWVHTSIPLEGLDLNLPSVIESHNSQRIFIPKDRIESMLGDAVDEVFAAVVQDPLWKNSYSKPFRFPKAVAKEV